MKQYTACKGLPRLTDKVKTSKFKKKKLLQWFHAHKVNKGNKTEDLKEALGEASYPVIHDRRFYSVTAWYIQACQIGIKW